MEVLCEIVEISDKVIFEFSDEQGKKRKHEMTPEVVKMVKDLGLLYDNALFIVEEAGDSFIIKACEGDIELSKELWECS
jgi:hypothetical protein